MHQKKSKNLLRALAAAIGLSSVLSGGLRLRPWISIC